ncbi:hypothetical protein JKG47_23800, partial [Acidithiobacillus sp. MC6.1]|nr:hypothetical protein [Acidithiobacillus sp. MC6.1]
NQGNIDALKIDLTEEDVAKIDESYLFNPGFPNTFLSGTLFGDEDDEQKVPQGPQDVWLTNIMGTFDFVEGPKPVRSFKK